MICLVFIILFIPDERVPQNISLRVICYNFARRRNNRVRSELWT
jgi:hypothetical protein